MNHQIKPCNTDYDFYNAKTLTVPLRNVSKLVIVHREDHFLNKPPNSMLWEINNDKDFNKFHSMTGECGNVIANSLETF